MYRKADFLICGAGPVGLYAACLLVRQGRTVAIIDKAGGLPTESRAIGIHPPSLELFAKLGLAEPMVAAGVRLQEAQVFVDRRPVGRVDFGGLPTAFPFVLSLPQAKLVRLLRDDLLAAGVAVGWRLEAESVAMDEGGVRVVTATGEVLEAASLLVCDGRRSGLRERLACGWRGRTYPDTYVMGDAEAIDAEPEVARVWLGTSGLVESLPMPGGRRRWVVRQAKANTAAGWGELRRTVLERTGETIGPAVGESCGFRTHGYVADQLVRGRAFVLGDAAHVVSPIGGQGMNLGWLNAADLLAGRGLDEPVRWQRRARRRAGVARRQAYLNMALGRPQWCSAPLAVAMSVGLRPPVIGWLRRRFAMLQLR